ncbi:Crp/Fnr family transcriptional regulator [Mangrovibrevibacter kandeliae]|uniref:Crp/Fnr family transcriptional regulator n=1 Tax=Mangrovibrevibacter kandeliae TaxID=2968473 RepID=UPI0021180A68|nr:Crp/Fnr family transcriptional regulator [Aurantimonas sp. CSK15Z-1]MCQ8781144.1 Crp/Fnr family transcriptional regulator [Aurantimonas sp. CSK15Z-1]
MLDITKSTSRNLLLRHLGKEDLAAVAAHLERLTFDRGDKVVLSGEPIESVVFPESGIFSVVLTASDQRQTEVGIFGREGMSDGSIIAGIDRVPHHSFVQVPGSALRISARVLAEVADERPALRVLIGRWLYMMSIQTAQTALANGNYNIEERLARWILMCQDRLGTDEIALTHDFLGVMLSVRRSSVTLATHMLEGSGLIRASRGLIKILDREALLGIADGCYGLAESEYERIIGPFRDAA